MTFFDRLVAETAAAREEFLAIPILRRVIAEGATRALYLRYLEQAYHHVRHTCPLLGLALARCAPADGAYARALIEYIDEEKGHDEWILDDIAALGGDAAAARAGAGGMAVRVMVGYATYAVDRISPHALLGMVHVLEGMSVVLAQQAAQAIGRTVGAGDGKGFSYLTSHGAFDQSHVRFFEDLVNGIGDRAAQDVIIDTANIIYRLFGNVFRELDAPGGGIDHAA